MYKAVFQRKESSLPEAGSQGNFTENRSISAGRNGGTEGAPKAKMVTA